MLSSEHLFFLFGVVRRQVSSRKVVSDVAVRHPAPPSSSCHFVNPATYPGTKWQHNSTSQYCNISLRGGLPSRTKACPDWFGHSALILQLSVSPLSPAKTTRAAMRRWHENKMGCRRQSKCSRRLGGALSLECHSFRQSAPQLERERARERPCQTNAALWLSGDRAVSNVSRD